jgi:hypothetical protein
VDVQFLVGPVELRPQGQVDRILEMPAHGLDVGLAAIGLDDLGGRPIVAISAQDDAAQAICVVYNRPRQLLTGKVADLLGKLPQLGGRQALHGRSR